MTFRSRLLRLLLVFSLMPTLIMAVITFWLTAESFDLRRGGDGVDTAFVALLEYEQADAEQRLRRVISPNRHLSTGQMAPADVIFRVDGDSVIIVSMADASAMDLLDDLDPMVIGSSPYWHTAPQGTAQIVCREDSALGILCAAKIYAPSYRQAIQLFEGSHRQAIADADRQGYYFAFIGILLVLLLLSATIVAIVLSRRISTRLAKPIAATTEVVDSVAGGDFSRRVHAEATGEVAVLVQSVNRMAQQLDDLTRRLSQSERVAAWRGVARRFAHELRNPLQPIAVSLYQIRKALSEGADPGQIAEPLAAIDEEIKHLTNLAERFSALSRMPAFEPECLDLSELVQSIGQLYRERLASHDFRLSVPDDPVWVTADHTYLREAIHNLLKNAREATNKGKAISLTVAIDDAEFAVVEVADQGRGMDTAQVASAPLPYFTSKEGGSGLGLAIVEKVASDCGGRLDIESCPGIGTTMRLIIPLAEKTGE